MTRSFTVPILLPADPTIALEAATKQYVDSQAGGAGDQYRYDWVTTTTASDPGAGKVKCNNADPSLATAVYISMYDDIGVAGIWLLDLAVGGRFGLYEVGDINTFIRYEVSGTVTNTSNIWFSIPVTVHEEGTSGFTPGNNQTIQLGPSRSGISYVTQTAFDAHLNDTTDAHDASAVSFSPTGTIAATDVQAAIAEVASEATGGGSASGTKLSALSALAAAGMSLSDLLEILDVSDTTMAASGTNKKGTLGDLVTFLNANGIMVANDSITNTKLAPVPTLTIKGNNTGSTTGPLDLTVAQVKTMLSINEIHVGTTAPGTPAVGDLWVDTT